MIATLLAVVGLLAASMALLSASSQGKCGASRPALYIGIDVGNWSRSSAILSERLAWTRSELVAAAGCRGVARVVAFTNSTASTRLLFDGQLNPQGGTEEAWRRKAPGLADHLLSQIQIGLTRALQTLPGDGTDAVGQFDLAREWFAAQGNSTLRMVLLTDGISTAGLADLNVPGLTQASARRLAGHISIPRLAGAEVAIAGIGEVAQQTPSSRFVAAIKAFWSTLCSKTAATCSVTSFLPEEAQQ